MNPYESLPKSAFWRPAVADRSMFEIADLWQPKFAIKPDEPVSTFGSCFAQHIGRNLKQRGYNWLVTEIPPWGMSPASAKAFNYNFFSCRTGNIYTTSLLRQWTAWALGKTSPPEEYWEKKGRYYDPFRPAVEPDGFESPQEMRESREETIKAFRACIGQSSVFVFTLGLTESWSNSRFGYEYPMCPGTIAGEFDASQHRFANLSFAMVRENLSLSIAMMREFNPKLRFLLTVSPVPLTATNSGRHVLVATMASKSILRAVADAVAENNPYVDYFPSYEIVNSPVFKGAFFEPNQRQVADYGVAFVMEHFFSALQGKTEAPAKAAPAPVTARKASADEACEEELLDAFGGGK